MINVVGQGGRYDALIGHFRNVLINTGIQDFESVRENVTKCKQTATGGAIRLNEGFNLWNETTSISGKLPLHQYITAICIVGSLNAPSDVYNNLSQWLVKKNIEFVSVGSSLVRTLTMNL